MKRYLEIAPYAGALAAVGGVVAAVLGFGPIVASANTIVDYSTITTAVQDEFTGGFGVVAVLIGALLAVSIVVGFLMSKSKRAGR